MIPAIAVDHRTNEVLMMAYMNDEALRLTLSTGTAVYYSRSRKKLWHKGEESGNVQKVREILIDCDQDTLVLKVEQIGGAACHNGYRSCFYRATASDGSEGQVPLKHVGGEKVFDPAKVYGSKSH
ncbi:MAG: phosphoribosyl-AMP cyclohydrolase [Phycisphaeraceae bacterium]|nr:phosphoribosyl-AMP cyclohydrolase [Phycisphaeraceae bacterium]